jgi:hypothetical protein
MWTFLKGFTGAGLLTGLVSLLASPEIMAVVPEKYATIGKAVAAALVIVGIRRRLPTS